MALNENAIIDVEFYNTLAGTSYEADDNKMEAIINAASQMMEVFCNRILLATDFSYDSESAGYNPKYAIFDGISGRNFWFPTYPVNSVTEFNVSGTEIILATDYSDTEGYFLYREKGLLVYDGGFDLGYYQNVTAIWNGGYEDDSTELSDLKMICYEIVKTMLFSPKNSLFNSEKIGHYSYKLSEPTLMTKLFGFSPTIFSSLSKYRREIFA